MQSERAVGATVCAPAVAGVVPGLDPDIDHCAAASGTQKGRVPSLVRRAFAPAAAGLLAMLASVLLIRSGQWSTFDEYTHFDYVVKVAQSFDLPPVNDQLGSTAIQAAACQHAPGFEGLYDRCGQDIKPGETPYAGMSTATNYLPTYYLITGALARAAHPVVKVLKPGQSDAYYWLTASRLVGSLYLGLLAGCFVLIARKLGAYDKAAAAMALLAATSPLILLQFSTVNNDALGVLLTAVGVLTWLLLEGSRPMVRIIVPYGVALVAMTAKETALVALVAIMMLHLSRGLRSGRRLGAVWPPLLGGAVVLVIWLAARQFWPEVVGAELDNGLMTAFINSIQGKPSFRDVTGSALASLVSSLSTPVGPTTRTWFASWSILIAAWGFGAAVARSTMAEPPGRRFSDTWAASTGISLFLVGFPVLFVTYLHLKGSVLFFQPRYLLPAIALAVCLIAVGTSRFASWLMVCIAAVYYAFLLGALTGVGLV